MLGSPPPVSRPWRPAPRAALGSVRLSAKSPSVHSPGEQPPQQPPPLFLGTCKVPFGPGARALRFLIKPLGASGYNLEGGSALCTYTDVTETPLKDDFRNSGGPVSDRSLGKHKVRPCHPTVSELSRGCGRSLNATVTFLKIHGETVSENCKVCSGFMERDVIHRQPTWAIKTLSFLCAKPVGLKGTGSLRF